MLSTLMRFSNLSFYARLALERAFREHPVISWTLLLVAVGAWLMGADFGCRRPARRSPPVRPPVVVSTNDPDYAWIERFAAYDSRYLTETIAPALALFPDSNLVWAAIQAHIDTLAVEHLRQMSHGELARRLETIRRHTTHSPFTADQVRRAQALKDGREPGPPDP